MTSTTDVTMGSSVSGRTDCVRVDLVHRDELFRRFSGKVQVNAALSRQVVSWQANRQSAGFRWFRFKEGFSASLVDHLLGLLDGPGRLLDPFSGTGVTPLVGAHKGWTSTGVELLPVAVAVSRAMAAAPYVSPLVFEREATRLMDIVEKSRECTSGQRFPHLRITDGAFDKETEAQIVAVRDWLLDYPDGQTKDLLSLAAMAAMEDASWTSKDGQYLRWDHRSGRNLRSHVEKRVVLSYHESVRRRLSVILEDLPMMAHPSLDGTVEIIPDSCLDWLANVNDDTFDAVITSPPYANRYDYTRTYALELAWLGYDDAGVSKLRQQLLSATVENRSKREQLNHCDPEAVAMYDRHPAVHEVVDALRRADARKELPNSNVVRLVENYCLEMAFVVSQLSRICRAGASVFMVNDNVRYHGEELPVDLILSDMAEQCGFRTEAIWTLARGKGNSSQQMGKFGRHELRKCVYHWRKLDG